MTTRRRQRSAVFDAPSVDFTESELLVATCFGVLCLSVIAVLGVFVFTLADTNNGAQTTTAITTTTTASTFLTTATPAPTEPPGLNTCAGFVNLVENVQSEVRACDDTFPGTCSAVAQQRCVVTTVVPPEGGGDVFSSGPATQTVVDVCVDETCTTERATPCACTFFGNACGRRLQDGDVNATLAFICRQPRQCALFTDLAPGDQPEEQACALGTEVPGACTDVGVCSYEVVVASAFADPQTEFRQCAAQSCLVNDGSACSCLDSVCRRSVGNGQALFLMDCD